ncbi:PAS domain-containing protein [Sorangium sp. So ce1036]|uniref:PAS domain-containing protein n=1 Tax=Sorangium sp. So ce1036 TaxID=3133328 RepID=UPI003F0383DC
MLFVAGVDGALLRWSDLLGRTVGPLLARGTPLSELFHPEDRGALTTRWAEVRASATPIQIRGRILSVGRGYRPVACVVRGASADGLVHGSFRDLPPDDGALDEVLRLRERERILGALVETLPVVVWVVDPRGVFTYHEGNGMKVSGQTPGQLIGQNVFDLYGDESGALRRAMMGHPGRALSEAHGHAWETWVVPVHDTTGQVQSVIGFSLDVTQERQAQQVLQMKLDVIEAQQRVIRELTAPIIEVWDGVLALPMIGVVDSARTAEAMESLLDAISSRSARFAVLDLTGVQMVDTKVADHLIRLVRAIQLLGAEGIICGIRPTVAQTVVELGLDLSAIVTKANLRAGLMYCMQRLRAPAPRATH